MKLNRKLLPAILSVTMLISLIPASSQAVGRSTPEETSVYSSINAVISAAADGVQQSGNSRGTVQLAAVSEADTEGAVSALLDGINSFEEKIDISSYNIPAEPDENGNQVSEEWKLIVTELSNRYYELFHVDSYKLTTDGTNDTITYVSPVYSMTQSEYKEKYGLCDEILTGIADQAESSWSDQEKVLFIYDYLNVNYSYDTSDDAADSIYTFLTEGKGGCRAYALAFAALMDKLSIPVSYAESDSLNDVWNAVEIDGKWYEVDVTCDNEADYAGVSAHTEFMLSDTAMRSAKGQTSQTGWIYGMSSRAGQSSGSAEDYDWEDMTGTKYDDYFWNDVQSPFIYINGSWYYSYQNNAGGAAALYKWNGTSAGGTLVSGSATDSSAQITALTSHDGKLFYNDKLHVYMYDPSSGRRTEIYSVSSAATVTGLSFAGGDESSTLTIQLTGSGGGVSCVYIDVSLYTGESDGTGIYNVEVVSSFAGAVTIVPQDASGNLLEPGNAVVGDAEISGFYAGAVRLQVTYTGASEDCSYLLTVLDSQLDAGSDPADGGIVYIDQQTADSAGSVSFEVYPSELESGKTYYIYISGSGGDLTSLTETASYSVAAGTQNQTSEDSDTSGGGGGGTSGGSGGSGTSGGGGGGTSGGSGGSGTSGGDDSSGTSGDDSSGSEDTADGATMPFIDVSTDSWAYEYISWAYENGYVNGVSAVLFDPDGAVTRQQLWMIMARMSGQQPADMEAARKWAVDNGISDGSAPETPVTRQQMVTIMYRYTSFINRSISGSADLSAFPDSDAIASYAREAMAWATGNGIIVGMSDGTLAPEGTASRAQLTAVLKRYSEVIAG